MPKSDINKAAKHYVAIIERMERTRDRQQLIRLEEERLIWHNKLLDLLRQEGIPYQDREEVTRIAHRIAKEME